MRQYDVARGKKLTAGMLTLLLVLLPVARTESSLQDTETGVFQFYETEGSGREGKQQGGGAGAKEDEPVIPSATLSPQVAELPWNLVLVNRNNPVPEDWEVELVTLGNGRQVDRRILPELQQMFDDCRAAGLEPMVYTAYRSFEDQEDMLVLKYKQFKNAGYSHVKAQIKALQVASYPGYSEHQLGLAVDIDSANTEVCSNESVWDWMKHHCHKYGFIWRYPAQKSDLTGIDNEDWHFRYVGVEAATYIMENRLCLEEYLGQFYGIPLE